MHELDRILDAIRRTERGVVVTVIRTEGSTYRRMGARAVIGQDGRAVGAISGGCLERDLAERIAPWLEEMTPRIVTYDSTRSSDIVFGLGLGCRGILDLLIEPFDARQPPPLASFRWNGREPVRWTTTLPNGETLVELIAPQRALVVFGGGADVEPVLALAKQLGWQTDLVTTREAIEVDHYDAAVIMTHNFMRDVDVLRMLLASPIAYIGILGPKQRGSELLAELAHPGDPRIHNPIGLDLGGETPEEIALSIIAEIQAVLNRRGAGSLRERQGAIH
ncbi:MAG TPA: XdhC family protein [Thermoanaerobaculia bacterium]|nr:XdhC family protein [Thermoanaerobaculia bacterium]